VLCMSMTLDVQWKTLECREEMSVCCWYGTPYDVIPPFTSQRPTSTLPVSSWLWHTSIHKPLEDMHKRFHESTPPKPKNAPEELDGSPTGEPTRRIARATILMDLHCTMCEFHADLAAIPVFLLYYIAYTFGLG
jgi:hypothetical protein